MGWGFEGGGGGGCCVIQLPTIAIRPYTLVKLQFHQISIYLISASLSFLIIMSLLSKKRIT